LETYGSAGVIQSGGRGGGRYTMVKTQNTIELLTSVAYALGPSTKTSFIFHIEGSTDFSFQTHFLQFV
jgi:hypothetical protein